MRQLKDLSLHLVRLLNNTMGKVKFDSTNLNICSKSLGSALQNFDSVIGSANGLDVPDFAYQGWLNSLSGLLEEYKMQCKEDQSWVDATNIKMIEELNTSQKDIGSVEVQSDLKKEYDVN